MKKLDEYIEKTLWELKHEANNMDLLACMAVNLTDIKQNETCINILTTYIKHIERFRKLIKKLDDAVTCGDNKRRVRKWQ